MVWMLFWIGYVLGATNRKDVLDPALVRPGRFDRIVKVGLPTLAGRERILRVHTKNLSGFTEGINPSCENSMGIGKTVDLGAVAAATEGLSGAELELIVNEAAIFAVRHVNKQLNQSGTDVDFKKIDSSVCPKDFEESVRNFFNSRDKTSQNKNKHFGFDIASSGDLNKQGSSGSQNQIFKK